MGMVGSSVGAAAASGPRAGGDPAVRILVANTPRLCRDTVAALLRARRPQHAVVTSAPARLDRAVLRHAPALVICGQLTTLVQTQAPAWLLLYPGGADLGVCGVAGQRRILDGITFDDLLACVDRVAAQVGGQAATAQLTLSR